MCISVSNRSSIVVFSGLVVIACLAAFAGRAVFVRLQSLNVKVGERSEPSDGR